MANFSNSPSLRNKFTAINLSGTSVASSSLTSPNAVHNQQADDRSRFKLLLVGDVGTGKTAFIKRHLTGEFLNEYNPTTEMVVQPLDFFTNRGQVGFDCWDFSGKEKGSAGHQESYYIGGDCAIIMFDVTDSVTRGIVSIWQKDIRWFCDDIPTVLCGNKVDLKNQQVNVQEVENLKDCEISVKSNYNMEKPFLYLARMLARDPDLQFVEAAAYSAPEGSEAELVAAANQPLPD